MSRIMSVLVAAACGLSAAGTALGSDLLVGGENWRFKTDVDLKGGGGDLVAHHSSSAVTAAWRVNKNLDINLNFGTITSSLENEALGTSEGPGDGYYLLAGISVEQELDTGGGMLVDASYSFGWTEWSATKEYDHTRAHLFLGYLFGRGDRSRVFAGISYDTYESDLTDGAVSSYENDQRFSVVAGVRARSDTFAGTAELYAVGEWGFRLGLSFGF